MTTIDALFQACLHGDKLALCSLADLYAEMGEEEKSQRVRKGEYWLSAPKTWKKLPSRKDLSAAATAGWLICQRDDETCELQRHDEYCYFTHDSLAWSHVWHWATTHNDPLYVRVLAFFLLNSAMEYNRIRYNRTHKNGPYGPSYPRLATGRSNCPVIGMDQQGDEVNVPAGSLWRVDAISNPTQTNYLLSNSDDIRHTISLMNDNRGISYDGAWFGLLEDVKR